MTDIVSVALVCGVVVLSAAFVYKRLHEEIRAVSMSRRVEADRILDELKKERDRVLAEANGRHKAVTIHLNRLVEDVNLLVDAAAEKMERVKPAAQVSPLGNKKSKKH